ncbi:MAG: P1 family peptidase [Pseudomonadota bacterium]|nr:MAG: peptidase T4 [Pseudomonadota bacterium]
MVPGPRNLITDIPGLRVGNAHDERVLSGVTAVIFDKPNVASGITPGGAPGSRDTTLLEPEMTIQSLDAVVLSGGSLFGLDAAGGVVSFLRQEGRGVRIGTTNVPIASQAIIFDLLNGGDKNWGRMPPYWELGWQAAEKATADDFPLGTVGGGYGASTVNFKGGLGSASVVTPSGFIVGALAVVNAVGSVTIGDGPHFWAGAHEIGREFGGHGLPPRVPAEAQKLRIKGASLRSTTVALVATDAQLTKAETKRLAIMANDGLARAIRPAHAPMDGDTVIAVSMQDKPLSNRTVELTEIGQAAADCLARAIARGVYEAAVPSEAWAGPPAYRDLYP